MKRDASYQTFRDDLEDSRESIRMLEEGIHFAQKNLEACERRVSAQKGQRNKANSRYATAIDALNLEASSIDSEFNCGYSKMKLLKDQNRLEKDKLVLCEEKAAVNKSITLFTALNSTSNEVKNFKDAVLHVRRYVR